MLGTAWHLRYTETYMRKPTVMTHPWSTPLEKHYHAPEIEPVILQWWQDTDFNQARAQAFLGQPIDPQQPCFTITMPPPNVTGSLHLGHALSSTLQDILVRFHRMQGKRVLWVPGTDHAGIATQMMVEKQVQAEGSSRQSLGREAFVQRIWAWKEQYGAIIIQQMQRMGFAADWQHLTFTLDPGVNHAVRHAFVELHKQGLVYRAHKLVNWDTTLKTAVSDLEVVARTEKGVLWTLAYPHADDPTRCLGVSTTRPETLFADVAIGVHPDDPLMQPWIGQYVKIPLTQRIIPVIADDQVQQDKGTGAVKITPGHDPFDFAFAQRHDLKPLSMLDDSGQLTGDLVPAAFLGMTCEQARLAVIQALKTACVPVGTTLTARADTTPLHTLASHHTLQHASITYPDKEHQGYVWGQTDISHAVPYSERTQTVIQPRLTYQWFIDMTTMAQDALNAVHENKTRFVPSDWANNYQEWLRNIQPWCVSRQLWWGHAIPAWYGPDGHAFVAMDEYDARAQAQKYYHTDQAVTLTPDPDVLDTWFSSGLWPFSTLGWPDQTPALTQHYPTSVLVTGFDIIFFWVARMMMLGLKMTGQVPFATVYLHPLIRDAQGQKMSKTKHNVVNPLDIIDQAGADALRFALVGAPAGKQHLRFSPQNIQAAQHFMTKIWNSARWMQLKGIFADPAITRHALKIHPRTLFGDRLQPMHQWLIHKMDEAAQTIRQLLDTFRFQEASTAVQHLIRDVLCDWALECAKDPLNANPTGNNITHQDDQSCAQPSHKKTANTTEPSDNEDTMGQNAVAPSAQRNILDQHPSSRHVFTSTENSLWLALHDPRLRQETHHVLAWSFGVCVRLLHPFMPFLSEHLWYMMTGEKGTLQVTAWPYPAIYSLPLPAQGWQTLMQTVSVVRRLRATFALPPHVPLAVRIHQASPSVHAVMHHYTPWLKRLLTLTSFESHPGPITSTPQPGECLFVLESGTRVVIDVQGKIDPHTEKERLQKLMDRLDQQKQDIQNRLDDPKIMACAPEEVIHDLQIRHAAACTAYAEYQHMLAVISACTASS